MLIFETKILKNFTRKKGEKPLIQYLNKKNYFSIFVSKIRKTPYFSRVPIFEEIRYLNKLLGSKIFYFVIFNKKKFLKMDNEMF